MKKRVIIIPATVIAIVTPAAVITAKHLDKSSTAPVIISNAENWSKTAQVTVATAATFGGSDLDHYEYCISDTNTIDGCEWKTSSVDTIRVRNLGTSYVWVRAVSKYGVVSDASEYVVTRVDRNKPDASSENEVTTSSITVTVAATDDSGVKSYEYSINDSDYVADGNTHTFTDLASGTTYNIKVRITDLAGNTKILNFTQSTSSPAVTRVRSINGIDFTKLKGGAPNGGKFPSGFPGKSEHPSKDEPAQPEDKPEDKSEEPEEPEQPEQPEQPEEPEKPEKPEKPEQPQKPEKPEEPKEPEQPEQPLQPKEPENDDSASGDDDNIFNQPQNNDNDTAIQNSEPTAADNAILNVYDPSEDISAIE